MTEATDQSPPSERVAKLMEQSHGDLCDAVEQLAALMSAASAEMLDMICAVDRKESFRDDGATSTTSWVVAMLRVSHATAKEWVRVARRLDQLPHLRSGVLRRDALLGPGSSRHRVRHPRRGRGSRPRAAQLHRSPARGTSQVPSPPHPRRRPRIRRGLRFFSWRKDLNTGGYRYRGFLPAEAGRDRERCPRGTSPTDGQGPDHRSVGSRRTASGRRARRSGPLRCADPPRSRPHRRGRARPVRRGRRR